MRKFYMIVGIVASISFFSILFHNISEYKSVESYTESFGGYVSMDTKHDDSGTAATEVSEDITGNNNESTKAVDIIIPEELNHRELADRNSDFIGWIQSREISLPVVHTTDNAFYLNHDFDKKQSKYGSIFLDYRLNVDSDVLLLHGHNTSGDVMFGSLKKYANESGYFEKNKKFFVSLSTTDYDFKEYMVEDYLIVGETDDLLDPSVNSLEEYKKLLKNHIKHPSKEFEDSDNVIILSTCYGRAGTDKRLLLVLV